MKKIILFAVLFVAMMNMAMASYTVDATWNGNVQFTTRAYSCADTGCDESTISLLDQKTGTSNTIRFTGTAPQNDPDYYVLFHYPTDHCLKPFVGYRYWYGDGYLANSYSLTFAKEPQATCGSNVRNPVVKVNGNTKTCTVVNANRLDCGEVADNDVINLKVSLESAWNATNTIVDFIPSDLEAYYASKVNVNFTVNGEVIDTDVFDIPWNTWKEVSYDFTPTEPGTYILRIATKMDNDCKCSGSNYKYREIVVTVPPPAPSCGDSLCNDGASATCEPNGPTTDMKCANNVFTGNLGEGKCRDDQFDAQYQCTYCGDDIVDSGLETCDDGNSQNGDGCDSSCQTEFCGDGIFQPNVDGTCDFNVNQGPGHAPNCRDAAFGDDKCTFCGDGNLEDSLEDCDDGNNANGDGCSATCEVEVSPECGDGVVDLNNGEQCEYPNTQNNEFCPQSMEICKDGKLGIRDSFGNCDASCGCDKDRFEYVCVPGSCGATCDSDSDCDDQNPNTLDTCRDACTCKHENQPYCGDGIVGNTPGEQCDDGNNEDGDGCSSVCLPDVVVPEFDSTFGLVFVIVFIGGFLIKKRN